MAAVYRSRRGAHVVLRGGWRQLKIRGTWASSYRPGRVSTGAVWDALACPLLALPPQRRRSVLLLGLGGASAARVARALAPRARIVGVEIDAEVVALARKWFGLDALGVEVVVEDARRYLARSRARFDLVLEDVFVGRGRRVHKPDWMLEEGLERAVRRVAPGGMLASNVLDEAPVVARRLRAHFPRTLRIEVAGYDNRILVGTPAGLSGRSLRSAVASSPLLAPSLPSLGFRAL